MPTVSIEGRTDGVWHREESEEGHVHEQTGLQIVIELGVVVDGVREVRLQGLRQLPPRSPQVRARPFYNISMAARMQVSSSGKTMG